MLGIGIGGDVDAEKAKELGLDKVTGVIIGSVPENGAARGAGLKEGDVIIQIENKPITNTAELQETVSQYRPGDAVSVVVIRDKEKKQYKVTLRNKHGDTKVVRNETDILGAEFEEVSSKEKDELGIGSGIKIKSVGKGKLKTAGLKEGFIITSVNKKPIFEVRDFKREIGNARGGILVEGLYENGEQAYFVFGLD